MEKYKSVFLDYMVSFKQALIVFAALYIALWPVGIDGISMEPSLCDGDRVFISRIMTYVSKLDHGDVVMLKSTDEYSPKYIVKRVIGLPGDRIAINNGKVFINDELLMEDYIESNDTFGNIDILLGSRQYYFMGDNREYSYDSRAFGVLDKKSIVGKVVFRWYPINRMKAY